MATVKCADCGLLGLFQGDENVFKEASKSFRTEGEKYGILRSCSTPECMVEAHDLRKEVIDASHDPKTKELREQVRALSVITKPRECPRFLEWKQGFTPKEHIEMNREDEKNAAERDWQLRMEKDRNDFEQKMLDKQKEIIDEAKGWYSGIIERVERWKWVYGTLGGIVGAIIAIVLNKLFGINKDGTSQ